MSMKVLTRRLKNQERPNSTTSEKTIQIIAQNQSHTSVVMLCDSSVLSEQVDTFSIEGPYRLNCNKSRVFNYITEIRLWTATINNSWFKYFCRTAMYYLII
jgi:hypothetical protein